ncbi:MAG: NUDIX hydrolase [Actinomycetota bacterium]
MVEVRDAATVIVVRDGDDGRMQVCMLGRNVESEFTRGAYVFPGGAVDDDDRHADLEPICEGRADPVASALLGVEHGGLAFWVAGIRECFEEAGLLLAYAEDGKLLRLEDHDDVETFAAHRRAVDAGERRLVEVCAEEGLRLAVDGMHYFSHWITPEGQPRRYDTRFFIARAPDAQEALHDEVETIASVWITPAEALARFEAGTLELMPPTMVTLRQIGRFERADELLAAAAQTTDVPTIQPRVVKDQGGIRILLPGDEGFDDA